MCGDLLGIPKHNGKGFLRNYVDRLSPDDCGLLIEKHVAFHALKNPKAFEACMRVSGAESELG